VAVWTVNVKAVRMVLPTANYSILLQKHTTTTPTTIIIPAEMQPKKKPLQKTLHSNLSSSIITTSLKLL
jgi:hypothetical protein